MIVHGIRSIPGIIIIVISIMIMNHYCVTMAMTTMITVVVVVVMIIMINTNCHYSKGSKIRGMICIMIGRIIGHVYR